MIFGFQVESAKSKRQNSEEDSNFESMRAANKPAAFRKKLTSDEKADKRKMRINQRTANFEGAGYYLVDEEGHPQSSRFETMSMAEAQLQPDSGLLMQYLAQPPDIAHLVQPFPANLQQVNGSNHMNREADILAAMAKASPTEQMRLMGELEGIRTNARLQIEAARETDLSESYIRDVMTPVAVHEHVTASTDWLDTVANIDHDESYVKQAMVAEATEWFNRTSPEVREDVNEFAEQARGMARRASSALGAGYETFMFTAGRLLKQSTQNSRGDDPEEMEKEQRQREYGGSTQKELDAHIDQVQKRLDQKKKAGWAGGNDQAVPNIAPWSTPPQVLPLTGGGHAPFGVPGGKQNNDMATEPNEMLSQDSPGLNGQNFNPLATEAPMTWTPQPLDNGAAAWPAYDFLEGESLPPVAPDTFDPVGNHDEDQDSFPYKTSARKTAEQHRHYQKGFAHGIADGAEYRGPSTGPGWGTQFGKSAYGFDHDTSSWDSGTHKDYIEGYSDGHSHARSQKNHMQESLIEDNSHEASQRFNGPKQTFQDYQNRKAEGSYPMDEDHFAGSMAAVSPAPSNTTIPVTAMTRWAEKDKKICPNCHGNSIGGYHGPAGRGTVTREEGYKCKTCHDTGYVKKTAERGVKSDPKGNDLAGNPMAGYSEGEFTEKEKDDAYAQSGEAQTGLPLAPTGPNVSDTMFPPVGPNTGPTEVSSDRAFNIKNNSGQDDDQGAENNRFKESLSALHLVEADKIPGRGVDQKGKEYEPTQQGTPFKPDRSGYTQTPNGEAEATAGYEEAYSSNRHIDYSETGESNLGTTPVQGYGANPHGEMFDWNIEDHLPGTGAADVANVPAPGIQGGPGDPKTDEFIEGKEARLAAVKARVQKNLGR